MSSNPHRGRAGGSSKSSGHTEDYRSKEKGNSYQSSQSYYTAAGIPQSSHGPEDTSDGQYSSSEQSRVTSSNGNAKDIYNQAAVAYSLWYCCNCGYRSKAYKYHSKCVCTHTRCYNCQVVEGDHGDEPQPQSKPLATQNQWTDVPTDASRGGSRDGYKAKDEGENEENEDEEGNEDDPDDAKDGLISLVLPPSLSQGSILQAPKISTASEDLTSEAQRISERYSCQKLDIIRRRTSLSLRRNAPLDRDSHSYRVMIHVAWDLLGFLERNYEAGVDQYIKQIAAVSGTTDTAILCSVGEYFSLQWPDLPTTLLDSISVCCGQRKGHLYKRFKARLKISSGSVSFDSTLRTCTAVGSETFIIYIAQQLSWLAAVCHEKLDQQSCAFVDYTESEITENTPLTHAAFKVEVVLCPAPNLNTQSCWNTLLGAAVIVSGFPVPPRDASERGLEISVPAMAAMAGISHAVSFEGGFIFKGRCHAIVPVQAVNKSIQWHMVDTYPERLKWETIQTKFPLRLRGHIKSYVKVRSFVGWYPDALELIGTEQFRYASVQYSGALQPPASLKIDKLEIGFSQWGAINAGLTLGRRDGYKTQKPDNYGALLDGASEIPVIIYDTARQRAAQINAEDLMLHILLHRQNQCPSLASNTGGVVEFIDGASTDRRFRSTRETMKANAERVVGYHTQLGQRGDRAVLFKDEVNRLYDILDALWEKTLPEYSGAELWKVGFGHRHVIGWEYMHLVRDSVRYLPPKSVALESTHGDWPRYAVDVRALILFTSGFGDVYQPSRPDIMCPTCLSLSQAAYTLTVRVDAVTRLFEQQGCPQTRERLTDNGWTLHAVRDLFKQCNKTCPGRTVVALIQRPSRGKSQFVHQLPKNGVIILEKTVRSLRDQLLSRVISGRVFKNTPRPPYFSAQAGRPVP